MFGTVALYDRIKMAVDLSRQPETTRVLLSEIKPSINISCIDNLLHLVSLKNDVRVHQSQVHIQMKFQSFWLLGGNKYFLPLNPL